MNLDIKLNISKNMADVHFTITIIVVWMSGIKNRYILGGLEFNIAHFS